ncbi:hypothetical protein ACQ4PT_023505 [Festuca glaucescens]
MPRSILRHSISATAATQVQVYAAGGSRFVAPTWYHQPEVAFTGDRNRASPAPIIKIYNRLTPAQQDAIVEMGHGSFLNIKCGQLHNPVINWFAKCYQPARRAFVVPSRGVIPLTEESVHIMTGLPRGQLAVKYYCDYSLEAKISARLFPGKSSKPKVSEIGKMIEEYQEADDTFRELWLLFIVSTVVAPTTDTKISNKCYPMLQRIKAFSLMQSFASGLNGLLSTLVQGLTESSDKEIDNEDDVEPSNAEDDVDLCASESDEDQERAPTAVTTRAQPPTRRAVKEVQADDTETPIQFQQEASTSSSPPPMHSQIAVPTYSDLDRSDAEANVDSAGFTPNSPLESTQQADERIRGSAASLAASLSILKKSGVSSASESGKNNYVKHLVAKELGIHVVIHEEESESVEMNNATTEQEQHGLETTLERERLDHRLVSTAHYVAIGSKDVVAKDVPVLSKGVVAQDVHVLSKGVVAQDVPVVSNVVDSSADENLGNDAISSLVSKENRLKKRKRLVLPTTVPSRKSPRFARKHDASNSDSPHLITKSVAHAVEGKDINTFRNGTNSSVGTKCATKEDGKSSSSAFVVSPTVITNCPELKQSVVGDGKKSDIPISPTATKSQTPNDGNSNDSAIPISPTIADPQSPKPSAGINMCRSIVVSAGPQQQLHGSSDLSGRTWKLSPLVGAHLGVIGLGKGSPVSVSAEIRDAVRNLSESVKKTGETTSSGSSLDIISSQEDATPKFALDAAPLAWSKPEEGNEPTGNISSVVDFEEFTLSEEVQQVMAGNVAQLSERGMIELARYQIIKYKDSWAHTSDLADSIHGRGELSNHCMEVGIEYLRRTNTVVGKVSFIVFEEVTRRNKEGNHWYCLSLNIQAERFEVLDSMRGESNEALFNHASNLVSRIKAIWQVHYKTSKVQIENWELKVINVPLQETIFDCGFHALFNIDTWDGQNIPLLAKGDVAKLRRVMPHKWLTTDFNEEKDN